MITITSEQVEMVKQPALRNFETINRYIEDKWYQDALDGISFLAGYMGALAALRVASVDSVDQLHDNLAELYVIVKHRMNEVE